MYFSEFYIENVFSAKIQIHNFVTICLKIDF